MSTQAEIKQHLKAVRQTRQITNAMYLLSTSRMKKAMQNIDFNLLYMERLRRTIAGVVVTAAYNDLRDEFIVDNMLGTAVFVVVTSDKGLCGGYNTAVVDLALEKMKEHENPAVISLGIVGDRMFRDRGVPVAYSWFGASQHPTLNLASQVTSKIIPLYLTNDFHQIYVVYTEYVNANVQVPRCTRLLPMLREDFSDIEEERDAAITTPIFEPNVGVVFDYLVNQYCIGYMYDVLMQSAASENIARMNAMQNATRNADEMIRELSADLNAVRQQQITNEITEIAAACEAGGLQEGEGYRA